MAKKPTPKKAAPKAAPKSKAAPKKKGEGYIAKAPIRRLMKKEGADLVAAEALDKLIDYLEKSAAKATKEAINICKTDKRKHENNSFHYVQESLPVMSGMQQGNNY